MNLCLTQIIEADHEVLGLEEVRKTVHSRMMDPNAQVREAAIELLGKFLLVKEEFIDQYYSVITERIKDSGTAVRKRVIRIMREICEKYPNYEKIPEMLAKMVRRVNDEEGVKKLVHETFNTLWFHPSAYKNHPAVYTKVLIMSGVVQHCINEQTVEMLEQLIHSIIKQGDKSVLLACEQTVDALVDNILQLETKMASENDVSNVQPDGEDALNVTAKQKNNQDRLLSCLTTMAIFSKVRPELMVRHAETLQPYLSETSIKTAAEVAVMNEVIGMLERVVPLTSHPSDQFLQMIDENLTKMVTKSGMQLVITAISCASAIWHKFRRCRPKLTDTFLSFIKYLKMAKAQFERHPGFQPDQRKLPTIQRSIFTIGVLSRYFDFDDILSTDSNDENEFGLSEYGPEANPDKRNLRDDVFSILAFFSRSKETSLCHRALMSIGHFCAQYSEYLTRNEVRDMYITILNSISPEMLQLRIQVLRNLEMFLQTEEKKLIRSNDEWEKSKEQQNLKEMELSGSGLGSTVIQLYWNAALMCYFNADPQLRQATVQVAWLTLSQGLVTPGSSIATLIAMTTDPIQLIRHRVENLLKEIDSKYAGMVQSKANSGVRLAYKFQAKIYESALEKGNRNAAIVRGIRFCDFSATTTSNPSPNRDYFALPRHSNDGQALLSGLYQTLRTNRQQRRSFLQSTLKLFSDDSREKLCLGEWIFVADNLAMFPYQMLDEPLYVIRTVDQIVAQSGQSIVNQFKESLLPSSHAYGLNEHVPQQPEDDDFLFEPENLYRRFPDDKTKLYDLMINCQSCFLLLYLRSFLMKVYSFTEAKVQEYSPSEAAKVYEKAASRKNVQMFSPQSALEELSGNKASERNTMEGNYNLAHKINKFRKMLLTLDRGDGENDDVVGPTTKNEEGEEDEEMGEEDVGCDLQE
ncbi:unnamed protein product [Caenorhabditis auriculariae]|uniref:Nipped-B protein n=1 Tax=Caenorhabditis auriculariae TaxID=2777116 RepID=A0A8S1H9M3_9PELO|nr:unnamed protein product [Caenorhabditis auriculariae]